MRYAILRAFLPSAVLLSPTAIITKPSPTASWTLILAQATDPPPPKVPPKKGDPKPGGSGDPIPWGRAPDAEKSERESVDYERLDKALSDDRIKDKEVEPADEPPPK